MSYIDMNNLPEKGTPVIAEVSKRRPWNPFARLRGTFLGVCAGEEEYSECVAVEMEDGIHMVHHSRVRITE